MRTGLSAVKNNNKKNTIAQRGAQQNRTRDPRARGGSGAHACGQACGPPRARRRASRLPREGGESSPDRPPAGPGTRGLSVRTPTCKVDTSTGPLSCPTRKNSTVTVLSARRDAPARWVNSGKARARAQAEAKASGRSHTICGTERQSREEQGRGATGWDRTQGRPPLPQEPPAGSAGAHGWVGRRRCAYNLDTGAPTEPSPRGVFPPSHCLHM